MPIGPEILLKMVHENDLVKDLSKRELENPEGAGFDLRVGEVHKFVGEGGFMGIEERKTPVTQVVASYQEGERNTYTLKPGEYVLVTTVESVKLPRDIVGYLYNRTTNFRVGVQLLATQVAPGYEGILTMGLANLGPVEYTFEMGARLFHIQFERVEGGGNAYRGQWQGGRVAATETEKQV